ncbi:unnamed protein product [Rotaria sp. Silwood1]|nr:unnamed protein product [Rotaria sp. Silwood1]
MLACDSNSNLVKEYGDLFHMRNISGTGQIGRNELINFLDYVFKKSGEMFGPDTKDPATVASEIFGLLGSEENGTLNKEQFILG